MDQQNTTSEGEPILLHSRIFDVVERTQLGRSGKLLKRQIVRHPGAVGIVPILPDGRVLLINQYRIAFRKDIYEIPAGTREPNEEPIITAKREMVEETGYRCGKIELLNSIYTSPGVLQEELFLFLATDLQKGESAPEDGERIEPTPKTWSEIDKMLEAGEIHDAKTIAGLFLARRKLGLE